MARTLTKPALLPRPLTVMPPHSLHDEPADRAPALPDGGDLAADRIVVTDPRSGISFEVAMYPQYRQMQYEVSAAWGVKGIKTAHSAILLG